MSRPKRAPRPPFPVDKGVPLPDRRPYGGNKFGTYERMRYPWKGMEPGDSFFVACGMADQPFVQQKLISQGSYHGRSAGKRFTTRQVEGGVRIWRIA